MNVIPKKPVASRPATPASAPDFAELFTPKLITVLREGYGAAQLRKDAIAGLSKSSAMPATSSAGSPHQRRTCGMFSQRSSIGRSAAVTGRKA